MCDDSSYYLIAELCILVKPTVDTNGIVQHSLLMLRCSQQGPALTAVILDRVFIIFPSHYAHPNL